MNSTIIKYDFGDYSNPQIKHVINKLNNGKKLRVGTLIKFELEQLLDEYPEIHPLILGIKQYYQKKSEVIVNPVNEEPVFTKEDVNNFIKRHYNCEGTITQYLNKLKHVEFNTSDSFSDEDFWIEFIKHKYIKSILSPISIYLKNEHPLHFSELKEKISNVISNEKAKEILTARARADEPLIITADEILNKWSEYVRNKNLPDLSGKGFRISGERLKIRNIQDAILLGLYSVFPLRDDFGKVSIDTKVDDCNHLNSKTGILTINPKKGSKDLRKFQLPYELHILIKDYIKKYNIKYLFSKSDDFNTPMGNADKRLTEAFYRIFGFKVTINDIRRAFTVKASQSSHEEFIKMSIIQGHDIITALNYYMRTDLTDSDN